MGMFYVSLSIMAACKGEIGLVVIFIIHVNSLEGILSFLRKIREKNRILCACCSIFPTDISAKYLLYTPNKDVSKDCAGHYIRFVLGEE